MRALLIALILALPATVQAAERWRPLFNGRNLDGWIPKINHRPLGENWKNTFRVKDGATSVEVSNFGVLQVTDGWASFTARARWTPANTERAVTVVVDERDPASPGSPRLVLEADGEMVLTGSLQARVNVSSKR